MSDEWQGWMLSACVVMLIIVLVLLWKAQPQASAFVNHQGLGYLSVDSAVNRGTTAPDPYIYTGSKSSKSGFEAPAFWSSPIGDAHVQQIQYLQDNVYDNEPSPVGPVVGNTEASVPVVYSPAQQASMGMAVNPEAFAASKAYYVANSPFANKLEANLYGMAN